MGNNTLLAGAALMLLLLVPSGAVPASSVLLPMAFSLGGLGPRTLLDEGWRGVIDTARIYLNRSR